MLTVVLQLHGLRGSHAEINIETSLWVVFFASCARSNPSCMTVNPGKYVIRKARRVRRRYVKLSPLYFIKRLMQLVN